MVGATGAGVAASSAGVGCRRCRGVEQALQAGPPPTQLAGRRTFLMRFTSAEPMRRLTPAITGKGARYTVEAGPQARVQGCSGGQGRDVGGGFGAGSKPGSGARVGVEGAPVCGLLLGPPAYALAVAGHQLSSASRITGQRAKSVDDQGSRGHWTDKLRKYDTSIFLAASSCAPTRRRKRFRGPGRGRFIGTSGAGQAVVRPAGRTIHWAGSDARAPIPSAQAPVGHA